MHPWLLDFRVDLAFFGALVVAKFDSSSGNHSGGGEFNAIMGAIFDYFEEIWQKYDSLRKGRKSQADGMTPLPKFSHTQ